MYHMKEFFRIYWLSLLKVVRFEGIKMLIRHEWIPLAQDNFPCSVHKGLVPFHGYCDATAPSKPWEMNGQETFFSIGFPFFSYP
jgi:hypothetical protein